MSASSGPVYTVPFESISSSLKLSSLYWSTLILRNAELDVFFAIFLNTLTQLTTVYDLNSTTLFATNLRLIFGVAELVANFDNKINLTQFILWREWWEKDDSEGAGNQIVCMNVMSVYRNCDTQELSQMTFARDTVEMKNHFEQ